MSSFDARDVLAGFSFNPADVTAALGPAQRSTLGSVAVAVHPRFGALFGKVTWSLAPVLRDGDLVRFDEATALGRSWDDALTWLRALDDAMGRRFALWVHLGPAVPHVPCGREPALRERVGQLHWIQRGARDALAAGLAEALALRPMPAGRWGRDGDAVLWRMGAAMLVATDEHADVDGALRYATAHHLAAQPDALGDVVPYSERGSAPDGEVPYSVAYREGVATFGMQARREGDAWVWTWTQDAQVLQRRIVRPRSVARCAAAVVPGASPRLRAHLGRADAARVPAMHDVGAVHSWVAREAAGWEALIAVEEVIGGLWMRAPSGLGAPERLGVHLMRRERDVLQARGLADNEDEPPEAHGLPWPFVRTHGRELAVVGVLPERSDQAVCADRDGVIYLLDHEFGTLTPLAANALGYLEREALFAEHFLRVGGIGYQPALAVDAAVDDALLAEVAPMCVGEASDAISRWDEGDGVLVHRCYAHAPQRAATRLYTARAEVALAFARRVRAAAPGVRMQVRWGNDAAAEARLAAFAASELRELETRSWWDFGAM